MKRTHLAFPFVLTVAVLALVALGWHTMPVAAGPVAQVTLTPRPTFTPIISPTPTHTPAPTSSGGASSSHPPRLRGTIFDWGKGNMPAGVKVVLRGDGWEVPVQTGETGEYIFQDIGNEVAFLSAFVPDDRGDLVSMVADLPVRIDVERELIVNVAFYPKSISADPLLQIKIVPSSLEVAGDENLSYTITVINNWEEGINQVIVADYLPDGLSYINGTASQGSVLFDRGLVWVDLGPVAGGGSATVTIVTKVNGEVEPGAVILNKAAAYHSENAAVQNEVSVTVVKHSNGILPVTGLTPTLPVIGVSLVGLLFLVRRLRRGIV